MSRFAGAKSRAPARSSTRQWSGSAGWPAASSRRTSGCSAWRRRCGPRPVGRGGGGGGGGGAGRGGRGGGEGEGAGGSGQRALARQAEEEARRLERLAREQNSPELADAARRMQEAAEAMRRAAGGSPNSAAQGGTALDRLKGATRDLENARTSRQAEGVRGLERRARELAERQKEIAEGVGQLPANGAADRAERVGRLGEIGRASCRERV